MLLLGTLLVETSLTVVMKFNGQEPNMKMIGDIVGVVMIFGTLYGACIVF